MHRVRRGIQLGLLAVAIVATTLLLAVGGGNSGPLRPFFGFNEPQGGGTFRLQAELGVKVRRLPVGWNEVEPAPGEWRWGSVDQIYRALRRAGLRPLFIASAPPCWTHPSSPCSSADTGGTPPDPAYDVAWASFVRELARRYPAAVGIEIWNEENVQPSFLPYPNPARYTQLLQEAYRAVRSVSPSLPVISGGLFVSAGSGEYGIGDAQFLAGMYAAGVKGFADGIGIHLYPVSGGGDASPEQVVAAVDQTLDAVRAVMRAAHDLSTPIWITEVGVSTAPGVGSVSAATARQQADDLVAIVRQLRREPSVAAVIINRLADPAPAATVTPGNVPGYGVFRTSGTPKPAACALSLVFHGRLRC